MKLKILDIIHEAGYYTCQLENGFDRYYPYSILEAEFNKQGMASRKAEMCVCDYEGEPDFFEVSLYSSEYDPTCERTNTDIIYDLIQQENEQLF